MSLVAAHAALGGRGFSRGYSAAGFQARDVSVEGIRVGRGRGIIVLILAHVGILVDAVGIGCCVKRPCSAGCTEALGFLIRVCSSHNQPFRKQTY